MIFKTEAEALSWLEAAGITFSSDGKWDKTCYRYVTIWKFEIETVEYKSYRKPAVEPMTVLMLNSEQLKRETLEKIVEAEHNHKPQTLLEAINMFVGYLEGLLTASKQLVESEAEYCLRTLDKTIEEK